MEALWALGGVAVGVALTVLVCRQWLAVGVEVRELAAAHLAQSRAHLDRAAALLKLVHLAEGRAAGRERREKLAKTADSGARLASGGDPWLGWTGPPDPPVMEAKLREDRERIAFERERIEEG